MNSLLFVITFLPISLMPGINMTLALSFGMALGYRRTLPMLAGQVFSLLFIAVLCIFGIGALLIKYTLAFSVFKICSGIYLIYLGAKGFLRRGGVNVKSVKGDKSGVGLFVKGALAHIAVKSKRVDISSCDLAGVFKQSRPFWQRYVSAFIFAFCRGDFRAKRLCAGRYGV